MSWSEGRTADKHDLPLKKRRMALVAVNAVLKMLAEDNDLHEDMKLPVVKIAIDHWTGKNRLPADKAARLTDNHAVVCVLQKIQKLQYVCREVGMHPSNDFQS